MSQLLDVPVSPIVPLDSCLEGVPDLFNHVPSSVSTAPSHHSTVPTTVDSIVPSSTITSATNVSNVVLDTSTATSMDTNPVLRSTPTTRALVTVISSASDSVSATSTAPEHSSMIHNDPKDSNTPTWRDLKLHRVPIWRDCLDLPSIVQPDPNFSWQPCVGLSSLKDPSVSPVSVSSQSSVLSSSVHAHSMSSQSMSSSSSSHDYSHGNVDVKSSSSSGLTVSSTGSRARTAAGFRADQKNTKITGDRARVDNVPEHSSSSVRSASASAGYNTIQYNTIS